MKIAIYQPRASYYIGGGEIVPLEQAKYFSKLNHHVSLITTRAPFIVESDYFKRFKKENPKVIIKYINIPEQLKWIYQKKPGSDWERWDLESLHVGGYARAFFSSNHFDIIAIHNVLDSIAVPSSVASILHLHGFSSEPNYMQELALTIPYCYVADSQFIRTEWIRMFPWIGNILIVTNGIDSKRFNRAATESKKYDVVFVGRLLSNKGIIDVAKAIKILSSSFSIQMAIAGSGPEKKTIIQYIKQNHLEKNIHILGHVSDNKLVSLYQSAKIAILPSSDREGILTTMLEASSCGVPVITCDSSSMSEFIEDKKTGLLVPPKNSKRISEAIALLLTNEKLRKRISENARKTIEKKWDWHIKIKLVEKIYEKVVRNY
ncbi:MAG: glycosyltransferase family 4 protein [Patescibacteria group bacterium]